MGHEKAVFEGRTLEDAVKKGLEEIGRSRAEVMITILEEGSGGFLGLGARPYKVRIMPRPGGAFREPERERESSRGARGGRGRSEGGRGREGRERSGAGAGRAERGERGRRESTEGVPGRRDAASRTPVEAGSGREAGSGSARRDERRREGRPMRGAPPASSPGRERSRESRGEPLPFESDVPREAAPERGGAGREREAGPGAPSEGRRRRRGRRGGGSGADRSGRDESPREAPVQHAPMLEEPGREHAPLSAPPGREGRHGEEREHFSGATATMGEGPGMSPDELAATGKRLAEEFLGKMGFAATVTASAQEDHVDVTASVGTNESLLTGPKGEVRQSLQHLLNRMLNRGEGSRYHLQLEINEFWKHREDELRALAHRLAEEALAGNTEAFTEYLNAQERRIVHVALKEDARIKTYALGTGLIKRVAVAPADFPEGPRSD